MNGFEPQNADMNVTTDASTDETLSTLHRAVISSGSLKSGIKRASTACESCKRVKRKCDQQTPCSNCLKAGVICIYDQEQDGRRRTARKRTIEELESHKGVLENVFQALRDADDSDTQQIVRMIKAGVPLKDLAEVAANVARRPNTSHAKIPALTISALCDSPLVRVPAQPWTTATNDDDLVSHLISIFFTWFYPAFPSMVIQSFLQAMVSRDLRSQFCSPLLVNSILALACQFSDDRRILRLEDGTTTRGGHFLTLALQLWLEEAGKPSVTTIQAGQALAVALTLTGRDRLSLSCIDQLTELSSDLLFRTGTTSDSLGDEVRQSVQLALWSLYQLSVGYGMAFMRPRAYTVPNIEQPFLHEKMFLTQNRWIPYPDFMPQIDTNLGKLISIQYKLTQLAAEISGFVFASNNEGNAKLGIFQDIEARLEAVSRSLPEYDEQRVICPHTMDLYLFYHWMRVNFFHFHRNEEVSEKPGEVANPTSAYRKAQCWHSAGVMTSLYQHYFRDFGSTTFTSWMPQTACSLAYILSEDLNYPDVHDMFHDACIVVACAARRWFVMRGHIRMLYVTVQKEKDLVPERTRDLLRQMATESWQADSHKHFAASVYPHYALAQGQDPRTAGMGDLLERWANFNIDEPFIEREESVGDGASI